MEILVGLLLVVIDKLAMINQHGSVTDILITAILDTNVFVLLHECTYDREP